MRESPKGMYGPRIIYYFLMLTDIRFSLTGKKFFLKRCLLWSCWIKLWIIENVGSKYNGDIFYFQLILMTQTEIFICKIFSHWLYWFFFYLGFLSRTLETMRHDVTVSKANVTVYKVASFTKALLTHYF